MRFGARCDIGDDEVVASYGVYFSPALAGQTHVFQYPLRNHNRLYEADRASLFCTDGADVNLAGHTNRGAKDTDRGIIKSSSRLTMRCALDTFGSPNFKPGDTADANSNDYHYTLYSAPFVPKSDYCVAYFVGSELHLTPISTVQRMYPAHDAAVTPDDDESRAMTTSGSGALKVSERHTSGQAPTAVAGMSMNERFQRELNRQRSTVLNRDAGSAKQLAFFPIASSESRSMKQRLLSSTKEPVVGTTSMTRVRETPENSLFPPEILVSGGITGGTDKTSKIIRSFAARYSVAEQVTYLMLRCQVLSLPIVAEHVVKAGDNPGMPAGVAQSGIVDALRPRAVYMHGVWVSRVSLDFKGVAAALREVVLLSFYQSPDATVSRAQLNKLVNSAALRRCIKDILDTVATLNVKEPDPSKRRWRLQYVPETQSEYEESISAFKANFGAEEAAQHAAWERRIRTITTHLSYINISRAPPKLALETVDSNSHSPFADASGAGGIAGSPTSGSRTGSAPAAQIRDQDVAPVKQFVRALFAEYGVLNKMRAKEIVLKGRDDNYPKATNQMLGAALQSSVRQFTEATWVLTELGEPNVDKYRPFILQAALELKQFEIVSLHKRVEEIVLERVGPGKDDAAVPDAVLRRVVKEVAEFKGGERLWRLKNGNATSE